MAQVIGGPMVVGEMERDEDGYVTQWVNFRVQADVTDGPATVLSATGLPRSGDIYSFGDDTLPNVYCRLDAKVKPAQEDSGGPVTDWIVSLKFTNKSDKKRCKDQQIEDPLLEPDRISGGFSTVTEEATDAWLVKIGERRAQIGGSITNSAFEAIRGANAEFDAPRSQIKIEQNVPNLDLPLISSALNCVNQNNLWGMPPRFIKLNSISWERKFYGACYVYYTRSFEFAINPDGWDRIILDEGTKALNGRWNLTTGNWDLINIAGAAPNPLNPSHYNQYKDKNGENGTCVLDGDGKPFVPPPSPGAQWWCLNDCITARVYNGTCAQAKTEATNEGEYMMGPYSSEADAQALCTRYNCYRGYDPEEADCTVGSTIGSILVRKYYPFDFLLLGIPTSF